MICSKCSKSNDRSPQRYCSSCHAAYMREWRAEDDAVEVVKDLLAFAAGRGRAVATAAAEVAADLLAIMRDPGDVPLRRRAVVDVECLRLINRQEGTRHAN